MNDLISRQAAIEIIQNLYPGIPRIPLLRKNWEERYEPYIRTEKAIRDLPTAQKQGKWNKYPGEVVSPDGLWGEVLYECPYCGWAKHVPTNYCPQCGAKLEGARWMT